MALRMKEDSDDTLQENKEKPYYDDSLYKGDDFSDGFVDMSDPTLTENKNPYVIQSAYVPEDKQKTNPIVKIIILAVLILAVIIAFVIVRNKFFAPMDITADVKLSEEEFAAKYKLSFEENPDMAKRIPQWSNGTVKVKTGGDLHLVYIDGKRVGIHTSNKRYTIYGLKVGDPDYKAEQLMTFKHQDNYSVLNEMGQGSSTTYYYYNKATNECLATTVNENSNRIVALTYYSDFKKISESLDFN